MGFLKRLFGGKKPAAEEETPAETLRREMEIGVKAAQYGWGEYLKRAVIVDPATLPDAIVEFAGTFRQIVDENLPFTAETIRIAGREDHFWFILFAALSTGGTHSEADMQAAFLTLRDRGTIPRPDAD
jgi:hypothetical protein